MSHAEPRNVVEILVSMVSIDSVNPALGGPPGGEAKLAEYLAFVAAAFGFTVRRLPAAEGGENLLVLFDRGPNRAWMLFDSHLDTVGVEGMNIAPFDAEIRDGKLWGRGACDTKGSGAAMLWALHEYAVAGGRPNNVAILYSTDEEVGMHGIRSFVDNDYPALGFASPGIVIGEPTRLRLVTAHNGICRVKVTTRGVAAHASEPSAGKSAISSMAKIVTALEDGYIAGLGKSNPLTGPSHCSINTIRGGSASNIIPGQCEIEIDRRTIPGEDSRKVVAELREALKAIKGSNPDIEFEMDVLFIAPPLSPRSDSPLTRIASRALAREELDPTPNGVTYATHGGDASTRGIDTVVFGPGDVAQAHTGNEWLDLEELQHSVRVYRAIMAAE